MNARTVSTLPIVVLFALAGCKNENAPGTGTSGPAKVQATTRVETRQAPGTPNSGTATATTRVETMSYVLLDNDPEYVRLRALTPYTFIDTLQPYKDAVEKREAFIRDKVGNISDPALHKSMAEDAAQSIPEVSKDDYLELAKTELQKQRTAYAESHKDGYFIVGTYDVYSLSTQKAIFNLRKKDMRTAAMFVRRNNFGYALKKRPNKYDQVEDYSADLIELANVTDDSVRISERYKTDALNLTAFREDCEYAFVVDVTPEQMDAAYTATTNQWSEEMKRIYAAEIAAGGFYISSDSFYPWSDPDPLLKRRIDGYFRRQAIWILATGDAVTDPENVIVREAWFTVGNRQIAKLK
jgi:hypothetical protein